MCVGLPKCGTRSSVEIKSCSSRRVLCVCRRDVSTFLADAAAEQAVFGLHCRQEVWHTGKVAKLLDSRRHDDPTGPLLGPVQIAPRAWLGHLRPGIGCALRSGDTTRPVTSLSQTFSCNFYMIRLHACMDHDPCLQS